MAGEGAHRRRHGLRAGGARLQVGDHQRAALDPAQGRQLGQEIKAELSRSAARDPDRPVTIDMISATPDYTDRAALIRNFVKQDPDRAALVVRDLLKDGVKADA